VVLSGLEKRIRYCRPNCHSVACIPYSVACIPYDVMITDMAHMTAVAVQHVCVTLHTAAVCTVHSKLPSCSLSN
jgi:hypothetical protein